MVKLSSILIEAAFKIALFEKKDLKEINFLLEDYLLNKNERAFEDILEKYKPLTESRIYTYMNSYGIDSSNKNEFVSKTYEIVHNILENKMRNVLQTKDTPLDRVRIFTSLFEKGLLGLKRLAQQLVQGFQESQAYDEIGVEHGKSPGNIKRRREVKKVLEDVDIVQPITDKTILEVLADNVQHLDPIEAYYWYRKFDITNINPKIINALAKSLKIDPEELFKNLEESKLRKVRDEDIAKELNITKGYMSKIITKSKEKLKNMEEIKELIAKKKIAANIFD